MVKTYSKYELSQTFGTITSATSNILSIPDEAARSNTTGRAVVAANEDVYVWDIKKGELLSKWRDGDNKAQVTAIARSVADPSLFAVGYGDGTIRIWDSRIESVVISFNGHKSAVTALVFDNSGARLASGAKDTDIIIWDLVGEVGLFKLRGHKEQVVALHWIFPEVPADEENGHPEESSSGFILSASKDALVKIWDIVSQHCIETHLAQTNGECWAMGVSPDSSGCITAGNDGEMRVWSVDLDGLRTSSAHVGDTTERRYLHDRGILQRYGKDRPLGLSFHSRADYFAVHGSDKAIELWRIRSQEEVQKSMARKRRRKRGKEKAAGPVQTNGDHDVEMAGEVDEMPEPTITDYFTSHVIVRTGGKVHSMDWIHNRASKGLRILTALSNNQIEAYDVPVKEKSKKSEPNEVPEYVRSFCVDMLGHRTDVRGLALSLDDRMLATGSSGNLKIWNIRTGSCLRTLECGYALCCAFLPGDKLVVVGNKSGELQIFDIASSTLLESFQAHDGSIWTMQVHPEGKMLLTGGADKTVKFWKFKLQRDDESGAPSFQLKEARVLKLEDDVLSICISPDSRLLAVATLDNTVKVFFIDRATANMDKKDSSIKLFLNLYGHKLPVLNMSISADSKLIATCSADKNVRLWGLDFGDCHKAFFAHQDSIMQVSFIPQPETREETHYFFSASKDRLLKSWDGDKFERIQNLDGHHGEIWAMAVSKTGDFVVTASHDKSIRVWSRTDEPIFLEEEREREMEELYESTLATSLEADGQTGEDGEIEAAAASKQTAQTLTAGERIMEALSIGLEDLSIGLEDLKLVRDWKARKASNPKLAPPQRDPLFTALGGISAERHVLNTFQRIPAAQLHDALLVLPFSVLPSLFTFISIWVRRQWDITLTCRVLFFMIKTHQKQIVTSKELKGAIEGMRRDLRSTLGEVRDLMGYNVAAVRFVEEAVKEKKVRTLEDAQAFDLDVGGEMGRKRAFADIA